MILEDYHFYINLEKRNDRRDHCENQLKSIGIKKPNRFNAIENKIGLIGCAQSHIKCLEIAKENNYPFVCIFEDDVLFIDPEKVIVNLNKYIDYDYDVLYIGAWLRNNKYKIINDDLIKVDYTCCLHSYIVKNHYFDTLLDNLRSGLELKKKTPSNHLYNIDEYIGLLQEKDNWLCFNPILSTQIDGYSDNFKEIRNYEKIIKYIPVKDDPYVSILTPTFNRKQFLPLMISNIRQFNYPKPKLEWLLLDSLGKDGEKGEKLFDTEEEKIQLEKEIGIKINYHYIDLQMNIGEKRNWLSANAKHDILINMDDDDIYFEDYIKISIDTLLCNKVSIVGCLDMLFIYPLKDYQISYIKCVNEYALYNEATLCMTKLHWEKFKYITNSKSEGQSIYGEKKLCGTTYSNNCIICVCWDGNTINKDIFLEYKMDLKIECEKINILKNIFSINSNMNTNNESNKELNDTDINDPIIVTKEVSVELLTQMRDLIEVVNSRMNWKLEELYHVGIVVNKIDEIIKK